MVGLNQLSEISGGEVISQHVRVYLIGCYEHELRTLRASFAQCPPDCSVDLVPTTTEELLRQQVPPSENAVLLLRFRTSLDEVSSLSEFFELECLLALRLKFPQIPWIAISNEPNPIYEFAAGVLGAVDYWFPPVGFAVLSQRILALHGGEVPEARPTHLFDKLLFTHLLKQSAAFRLETNEHLGFIIMINGELRYARTVSHVGTDALLEMLTWSEVNLQIKKPMVMLQENITLPFWSLVQELALHWKRGAKSAKAANDDAITPLLPLHAPEEPGCSSKLNQLCESMLSDVSGSLKCGIVDLDSGMLMASDHTLDELGRSAQNIVSSAMVSMFRGQYSHQIQTALLHGDDAPGEHPPELMQEIFVKASELFLFMKLIPESRVILLLVTKPTANRALAWMAMQSSCASIGTILPS